MFTSSQLFDNYIKQLGAVLQCTKVKIIKLPKRKQQLFATNINRLLIKNLTTVQRIYNATSK